MEDMTVFALLTNSVKKLLKVKPVTDQCKTDILDTEGYDITSQDLPYFSVSPGRFFIHPDNQSNDELIFNSLRAPVIDTTDLIKRICLYIAAVTKFTDLKSAISIDSPYIMKFTNYLNMASIKYEIVNRNANFNYYLVKVYIGMEEKLFDPMLGIWCEKGELLIGVDKLWSGMPYSGLKLLSIPISDEWMAPHPLSIFTKKTIYELHNQ